MGFFELGSNTYHGEYRVLPNWAAAGLFPIWKEWEKSRESYFSRRGEREEVARDVGHKEVGMAIRGAFPATQSGTYSSF